MSIDMKNYAGAPNSSAAESNTPNSYQQETSYEDVNVDQGIIEQVSESLASDAQSVTTEAVKEPTQQELNFKALREEIERFKGERDELKQNLDLLKANVQQQQYQNQPKQESKQFLDGLKDNDIPNVAEIRQAFEQREAEYQLRLEELQVQQAHPDYAEVLEKYTAPLLKQKPHLAEGIYGARNKALFAYELGKMVQGQQSVAPQPTQQSVNAQKIVENSKKPGNIAQAGGQSRLSQSDYYATMSDQEFMKMASKHLEAI